MTEQQQADVEVSGGGIRPEYRVAASSLAVPLDHIQVVGLGARPMVDERGQSFVELTVGPAVVCRWLVGRDELGRIRSGWGELHVALADLLAGALAPGRCLRCRTVPGVRDRYCSACGAALGAADGGRR